MPEMVEIPVQELIEIGSDGDTLVVQQPGVVELLDDQSSELAAQAYANAAAVSAANTQAALATIALSMVQLEAEMAEFLANNGG